MKIEEILTLNSLSDQLSLLRQNCNQMKPNDIIRSIKFYENDHKIKRDKERQDMYVIEKALASDGKTTIDEGHVIKKKRHAIPYQQQIVSTACAFVLGNKIDLILNGDRESEANIKSFDTFSKMWNEDLRMMTVLRKAFRTTCIETRSAINFFLDEGKIRAKVLSLKEGYKIYRHKNDYGKLDAVIVEYKTDKIKDGKIISGISITEIWTATEMIQYENDKLVLRQANPTGKLLFAYIEQDAPEYESVKDIIDAQDYSRSQHSDVNIRIGNPALVVHGKLATKPRYNDDVKIYEITPPKGKVDTGKQGSADMKYLEVSSAPESIKLELENNERDIYRFTWPDLSTLLADKSFSDLSTDSIRMMFLQAFVKLAEKQEIYDDIISRIISILKTLAATAYGDPNIENLEISFKYNSILPDSDTDMVNMLAVAVGAGLTSYEQAIRMLSFNTPGTLDEIKKEKLDGLLSGEKVDVTGYVANPKGENGTVRNRTEEIL